MNSYNKEQGTITQVRDRLMQSVSGCDPCYDYIFLISGLSPTVGSSWVRRKLG